MLDERQSYNETTGYFTIPSPGLYWISVHLCVVEGSTATFGIESVQSFVHVTIGASSIFATSGPNCKTLQGLSRMSQGDIVFVQLSYYGGDGMIFHNWNEFSVVRLSS